MNIASLVGHASPAPSASTPASLAKLNSKQTPNDGELRKTFDSFVGEVFFGQMLESMRKTVGQAAYMNGGRGEEVFMQQLDQTLAQEIAKSSASQFTGPMFDLFQLSRG